MSTFCKLDCADPVAQSREGKSRAWKSRTPCLPGIPIKTVKLERQTRYSRDRTLFKSVEINCIVYIF